MYITKVLSTTAILATLFTSINCAPAAEPDARLEKRAFRVYCNYPLWYSGSCTGSPYYYACDAYGNLRADSADDDCNSWCSCVVQYVVPCVSSKGPCPYDEGGNSTTSAVDEVDAE